MPAAAETEATACKPGPVIKTPINAAGAKKAVAPNATVAAIPPKHLAWSFIPPLIFSILSKLSSFIMYKI
ncbi:hypothetical protein GCM10011339_01920 [Echinicola rosea]|uniref:Uncharacterized protein n=1 Tax=Echinicola rosea TaxID=1807691 RepID=A0ABQ1UFT2_9BACT|nr:hypothetical protein GCM10011339_01920 [Echinicola rosea]